MYFLTHYSFLKKLYFVFYFVLFLLFCLAITIKSGFAVEDITEQEITTWFEQMSGVINSRNFDVIKSFFSFYSSNSAIFIKNSALYIDGGNDPSAEDKISLGRDDYIKYLYNLTQYPKFYAYKANLTQLQKQKDGTYIASVSIEEIAISEVINKTQDTKDINKNNEKIDQNNQQNQTTLVKTLVSTNCNMTFSRSATLLLLGSNCLEKIAIQ